MSAYLDGLVARFRRYANDFCPSDFGRVAVLYGGNSSEREISLQSGQAVINALRDRDIDVTGVDTKQDVIAQLLAGDYHTAFVSLHGPGGECGVIQGVLETLGIRYTGSRLSASALTIDKVRSKQIMQHAGIPTPPFYVLNDDSEANTVIAQLGLPLAIKPVLEGSTIGISKVSSDADFAVAYQCAKECSNGRVFAESWIEGNEYTVGILHDQAMPSILIKPASGLYDYHAKYVANDTQFVCPSGLSASKEAELATIALRAYSELGCCGWGRVDVVCNANGDFNVLEVNTIPGLTSHSLVPMAASKLGLSYSALIMEILATALLK